MNKTEQRQIALGAARSYLRAQGNLLLNVSTISALAALDDSARIDKDTIAAQWYLTASTRQVNLFKREWKQWQVEQRALEIPCPDRNE